MATGLSTANLANKWLDMMGGTAFTAPATVYVKLHTGDPGASAATAASANTTRAAVTWSAASAGSKAMSGTRDGVDWPARGGECDLPAGEAADLIAAGYAVAVPVVESAAVDTKPSKRAAARPEKRG